MTNNELNPDAGFIELIKNIGGDSFDNSFKKCFQCGTCSVVCPLTHDEKPFPRKEMILTGWGLKDKLVGSLDPWLCYYCGKCSENCPRKANPAELMMSLRRWLITVYDWTGISKLLYKSKLAEFVFLFIIAIVVFFEWILLFGLFPNSGNGSLNQIIPPDKIDLFFDWPMTAILSILLISFIFNMYYKTILSDKNLKIPIKLYISELWALIFNFFTQYKYSKCENDPEPFLKKLFSGKYNYWLIHWFLMTSYVSLFVAIVFFLYWFQTDYTSDLHVFLYDYYASIGLLGGLIYFTIRRIVKKVERSKFSHHTDWTFIILLFLTALTGVILRIVIVYKVPIPWIFYLYLIHMMILMPMLIVEVPFSKWSHLAYRPVAVYLSNLRDKANLQDRDRAE